MASRKDWKKTKTIHWKDEINQDFNEIGLKRKGVPQNYKYIRKSPIYWFFSHLLYYVIAKPLLWPFIFLHGVRTKNKKALKAFKGKGAFIYANHVAFADCFKYELILHKRLDIIGFSDALSIPVAGKLASMLGYIPLPLKEDRDNFHKMVDGINYLVKEKHHYCLIFPEAHIWPYYTKIRNWKNNALIYPALLNAPIIPAVTVWQKRWWRKTPYQRVVFGTPIYPKEGESITYNKDYLHQECIAQMHEIAKKYNEVEYIKYIKDE